MITFFLTICMIVVWVESANFAAGIFRSDSYVEILPLFFIYVFSLFPVFGKQTCYLHDG